MGGRMKRIWRDFQWWLMTSERLRCAEIARKPSSGKAIPGGHDPYAWGSGYLQASDDIVKAINRRSE